MCLPIPPEPYSGVALIQAFPIRRFWLSVSPGLAPQPELFLDDPVGEAEQHRLALRMMAVLHPARHDEDIVGLPGEFGAADPGLAGSFNDDEDGAVGRAVGLAGETRRQQLDKGSDRRHRERAARRLHITPL